MLRPVGTLGAMATWSSPQCPFLIQYSRQLMDDIRLASISGRFATPRGGMEIGGILLGQREQDRIIVSAQKPLDCEHGFGPLFRLSDNDRLRMAGLLSRSEPSGLTVLGWYRSVSRGEISLSEADLELYSRYFPEQWSVALLIKPSLYSTSAGFFFREQDGSIRTAASYREWQLEDELSNPQVELPVEAPKPQLAKAATAVEQQTQAVIDPPVAPPPAVPPSIPAPLPVKEQTPSIRHKVWSAPTLPALSFPRISLPRISFPRISFPVAAFRRIDPSQLRAAIRIPRAARVGAIVLFAALLFIWWNEGFSKSKIEISHRGGSRGAAQAGAPASLPTIRPNPPALPETAVQKHDAAPPPAKPTPAKKNVPFDPLVF